MQAIRQKAVMVTMMRCMMKTMTMIMLVTMMIVMMRHLQSGTSEF